MRRVGNPAASSERVEERNAAEDHHENLRRDREQEHQQNRLVRVVEREREEQAEQRA